MRVGILTISDRSAVGRREDQSGPALVERIQSKGWTVVDSTIVPDDVSEIATVLRQWADGQSLDLILTTGGTGFSPRDVAPEATLQVIDKAAPGLAEAMRANGMKITPHAMLSRAVAGIRGRTLVVNLPGSPKAARENLAVILPVLSHATELLHEKPEAENGHASHPSAAHPSS